MRTRRTQPDEYQTPPELMIASALELLSTLPRERRTSAMRTLVENFTTLHAGLPLPEWVGMFSDIADKESQA